jgi:hypothetical protein
MVILMKSFLLPDGILVALTVLLFFAAVGPVSAVPPGEMLVQVNPIPASVSAGETVTVTGSAPQVSAQQLQVWLVRGDAAWVSGTAIGFDGSFSAAIPTTSLAPGSYGIVLAAPYNGQYPVTYDSAQMSAVITSTKQPIYTFSPASSSTGPEVAATIQSTCNAVGADRNCVTLAFDILSVPTSATPSPLPTTTAPPVTTKAPVSPFIVLIGFVLCIGMVPARKK